MATTLAAEERATRVAVFDEHERRGAAVHLARHRAHRQDDRRERPELGEVLPELVDRIGHDRRRDRRWSGAGRRRRLDDLRQELREERRGEPDEQEQAADDRQPVRPPGLEQLLAEEDREAASSRGPRADEPQEHVLERRPLALEGGEADAARRRRPAAARPRRRRIGDRHDEAGRRPPRPGRPRPRPRRRVGEPPTRVGLARLGLEPIERQGVPVEQLVERALGRPAGRGRGSRPGRRPARRRRGRGSRR